MASLRLGGVHDRPVVAQGGPEHVPAVLVVVHDENVNTFQRHRLGGGDTHRGRRDRQPNDEQNRDWRGAARGHGPRR